MRKFAVLLLLAASCATEKPKATDSARKAFLDWTKAAAGGNAEATFAGLSDANKCEWLYKRLNENDPLAKSWRNQLTGRARTDLDLWWGVARKNGDGRKELAGESVLTHASLFQLFKDYYVQTLDGIRAQFSRLEVLQCYGDDGGVTVVVKIGQGPSEIYGLAFERGAWRIDRYLQPSADGR